MNKIQIWFKSRRPATLLLIGVLLVGIVAPIIATAAVTTSDPTLTIVNTLTHEGTHLEVGLSINSKGSDGKTENNFQSAGILLTYNASMVEPIHWVGAVKNEGEEPTYDPIPVATPTSWADVWTTSTLLPTHRTGEKAEAVFNGRTAMAFEIGGKNYLYLSAEALRTMPMNQALATEQDANYLAAENDTQKDAWYTDTFGTYPSETTAGRYDIHYTAKATAQAEQAVIVHFAVKNNAENTPHTMAELASSIDVAQANAYDLANLPLGGGAYCYIRDNSNPNTAGKKHDDVNIAFEWIADGITANAGDGKTEGGVSGYSVIFNLMGAKAIVQTGTETAPGEYTWADKASDGSEDVTKTLFATITGKVDENVDMPKHNVANERIIFRTETGTDITDALTFVDTDGNTYIYEVDTDIWKKVTDASTEPVTTETVTSIQMQAGGVALAAVLGGNNGPADTSNIRTVTFYDWDGTTKLGVIAVEAGSYISAETYANFLNEGNDTGRKLYDETVMELGTDANDPYKLVPKATEGYKYNPLYASKPLLTDKGGYTFVGWVPLSDEYSHYACDGTNYMVSDAANEAIYDWDYEKQQSDADKGADDPYPDVEVGEKAILITNNIDVKACYVANSKCGTGNTNYYTIEYREIERTGNNYTVKVDFSRNYVATANVFPKRVQEPILKITTTVGSTAITIPVSMVNQDHMSSSFTFPNTVALVQLALGDNAGTQGMAINATNRSLVVYFANDDGNVARRNYLSNGSAYLVNNLATSATGSNAAQMGTFTTAASFAPLGITLANNTAATTLNRKILGYFKVANAGDNNVEFTAEQIVAISNDEGNVYLSNVTFVDTDPRSEYLGGMIKWSTVDVAGSSVAAAGYKVYYSLDGRTKRAEVPITLTSDGCSLTAAKQTKTSATNYDRFLIVCAIDSSGTTLPASAVIPIIDLAED